MKNPFQEEDNSAGLLTGIIVGAITAGGIAYLYYKKKKAAAELAAYKREHAFDYLKEKEPPHPKKHKTDVRDLEHLIAH